VRREEDHAGVGGWMGMMFWFGWDKMVVEADLTGEWPGGGDFFIV